MGLRVLVADDSSLTRVLVSAAVRASRVPIAELIAVGDGVQALAALQRSPADVLLTDIQMPGIDGHELVARIARSPELDRVRVVTLSSATTTRRDFHATAFRVRAHLDKPVHFESLGMILAEIWRELQAEGR